MRSKQVLTVVGVLVAGFLLLTNPVVAEHPGGALGLRCEHSWDDAVVLAASLTAFKVGSLG
jgi:hypothetical protein